jgi:3-oxoacyl-[acyl-carrier protein] reductase
LIPGGARGIGADLALALGERGWTVALAYRKSADEAAAVVDRIRRAGGSAGADAVDVSDAAAAGTWIHDVERRHGRIDALVHAAGAYHRVDLLAETAEAWESAFRHNLHSLFYCARAVAPTMAARGWGRVLAFGLAGADRVQARTQVTAHFIAKLGVQVLIRSLARSLAAHGVTANTISPGFVDAGGAAPDPAPAIPAGRLGSLGDVRSAALYLLSDEAAYVNGANLVLSGGWGV